MSLCTPGCVAAERSVAARPLDWTRVMRLLCNEQKMLCNERCVLVLALVLVLVLVLELHSIFDYTISFCHYTTSFVHYSTTVFHYTTSFVHYTTTTFHYTTSFGHYTACFSIHNVTDDAESSDWLAVASLASSHPANNSSSNIVDEEIAVWGMRLQPWPSKKNSLTELRRASSVVAWIALLTRRALAVPTHLLPQSACFLCLLIL